MYRIVYTPTSETIAIANDWRDAAETLRRHSDLHNDNAYNAVTADPSVVLHYSSMGDGAYIISRDEADLKACSHCSDGMGIVTNQSDNYPHGTGSWQISTCADCAAEWERDNPREAVDYEADWIRSRVASALTPDKLTHGTRVRFTRDITRYPFASITAGETGTITHTDNDITEVTLDTPHDGLAEWDNALQVRIASHDIDDTDALARI